MQAILAGFMAFFCTVGCFFFGFFGLECPIVDTDGTVIVQEAKRDFNISKSGVQSLGLTVRTQTITTEDSIGRVKVRVFIGVRVSDVLQAMGADMNRIGERSTLRVVTADGGSYSYDHAIFMNDKTLLSWQEDNDIFNTLRFSPGATSGQNAYLFMKEVASFTLTY